MGKVIRKVAAAFVVLFFGLAIYHVVSNKMNAARLNSQVFGEVPDAPRVVALKPGGSMTFGGVYAIGSFRYDVNASLPVNTGVVQADGRIACFQTQIFSAVKSCAIQNGTQSVFILDPRTAVGVLGSALLGDKSAITDNKVTITTYHWGCVRNCVQQER